ncbi:MAG: enolase [Chloroflexi bacterium]|nr:enolase [Chloroflexota bacterium]
MPAITRINAAPYDLPLRGGLTWGSGHELRRLRHVLIRVELADGAVGIAEATPRPSIYGETQASILHIVAEHLAPPLLGAEVDGFESVAALSARLALFKNNNTAKGALDMALHQALANSRGERLADYLGATRERIQVSTIVSAGSSAAVAADVSAAYEAGLRVFKVKFGRDIDGEIETIGRLIEAYPAARFYVDANETLAAESAASVLNELHDLGVMHCEEALPTHLLRERRQLRRDCRMPIIADDSAFTLSDLEREITFDSFDILNIKTARSGYSQSRRMLEMCLDADKDAMIGSQASSLLGCMQAAVFAGQAAVNCASECSFYLKADDDLRFAPPIVDGFLQMPDVEWSLTQVQGSLVDFA